MRTLGYLFGILPLMDGLPSIFSPHYWVRFSDRNLRGYLPDPALKTVLSFGNLSENAVRAKAVSEVVVGMTLVFMASMLPSRFAGPGPMGGLPAHGALKHGRFVHSHEHVHELRPEEEQQEPL